MNFILNRAVALLAVAALSPILLGCGEDDSGDETTTAPSAPVATELQAINDALAASGFDVTSTTVGDDETPALLVEGDESVLVFEKSSVADLDPDALGDLASEVLDEAEPAIESCVMYTVVGPGGEFNDAVLDLVCG